jgi:hypothetical protein
MNNKALVFIVHLPSRKVTLVIDYCQELEAAETEVVLDEEDEPEDGCGEEESIDAVEDASVAGEHGAGVLDQKRFNAVE